MECQKINFFIYNNIFFLPGLIKHEEGETYFLGTVLVELFFHHKNAVFSRGKIFQEIILQWLR